MRLLGPFRSSIVRPSEAADVGTAHAAFEQSEFGGIVLDDDEGLVLAIRTGENQRSEVGSRIRGIEL